jgi:DNA-binding transcriptional MerR regulator
VTSSTYKLDELARAADVAARTVRYYVQRGLLPAPAFRGKDTAYGPEHLLRLRAVKRLQQAHLPLDAIQSRLADATPKELEEIASSEVIELELPPPAPTRGPKPKPRPALPPAGEAWERVTLAPGLELFVKGDASPATKRIAREILESYLTDSD